MAITLALLAGLLVQAEAPPAAVTSPEILVLAERMRRIRLETRTDRRSGASSCVFKRRSGDAQFDTIMCTTLLACAPTVKTAAAMEACMAPAMSAYARQLAARPATPTP